MKIFAESYEEIKPVYINKAINDVIELLKGVQMISNDEVSLCLGLTESRTKLNRIIRALNRKPV